MPDKIELNSDRSPTEASTMPVEVPLEQLESPALDRLIEEVRSREIGAPSAYNRVHHRHNR